eukprot:1997046-Amphidinium_carterae.2
MEEARKQYVTVTGREYYLRGSIVAGRTMVIGNIIMQLKFTVANVQSQLTGLPDMDFNELAMHTGNEPHIEQYGYSEPAMKIGSRRHIAAMVLPHCLVTVDCTCQTNRIVVHGIVQTMSCGIFPQHLVPDVNVRKKVSKVLSNLALLLVQVVRLSVQSRYT